MCIWWRFSELQSPAHKWSMWSTFRSNLVMRSQSRQRPPAAGRWGRRHQQEDWGRAAAQWTPGQSCGRPEELWWLAGREVWSSWPAEPPSPSPANTTSAQRSTEHSPNRSKRKNWLGLQSSRERQWAIQVQSICHLQLSRRLEQIQTARSSDL